MLSHDGLDTLGGLVRVVEWNGADVVVKDMSLDDAMEKLSANEAELAIDGGGSASGICPRGGCVMW